MLESASMLCARVMRGMASMLKLVMRRAAKNSTSSRLRAGARKPINAFPSGMDATWAVETGCTFKMQSAAAKS